MNAYAELDVTTNYSFLRGASHPDELVVAAKALGHAAIGIADRNSLAGVVRAHVAAKEHGLRLLVGARLVPREGPAALCYPVDRAAYARLSRLLTLGKRRAEKGDCRLDWPDILAAAEGQVLILLAPREMASLSGFEAWLGAHRKALERAADAYLALDRTYDAEDEARLARLAALAERHAVAPVASNGVLMHAPARKALLDVVTCIREGCRIEEAGWRLAANAERHLKSPDVMARLFDGHARALANTQAIVARCRFSLEELRYEYPEEIEERGQSASETLARLAWSGAKERYPRGIPEKVSRQIVHELALIAELGYEPYFLTVHDLVRFARARGILCQGRGSAANSAVCYCLGITAVDPARVDLLFERFVSAERGEPPDIDVDFEHERREEVIQYVYEKYGRERAGLAATVICYRTRGALRDVGKVMGLSQDTIAQLSGSIWGWSSDGVPEESLRQQGLDPEAPRIKQTMALVEELAGFPRHLSQHVGGFVITRGPLSELVPIENAAMEARTVIEWDKDDLDALGMLKVDVLGLGMLTCLNKAFDLLATHTGIRHDLASVPAEDPRVYDMLCKADSLGVFQVESRAQMTMLPRLKPRDFYDLVIEVAIVRPGPIQGDMVHPYLRRREGRERVDYPSEDLRKVLEKTLGVPLFQEQAMKIAIVGAGFTPSEADRLRRAMATFKRLGTIHTFRDKLVEGMVRRGYARDFAERCFKQIEGFGTYGFPESHAASFALLVYVSAWLKRHHPAVFAAALINSQPMGFYAPAQIVRDAREHGVEVRPPDLNESAWDCTLEPAPNGLALRLGLRLVKGLGAAEAQAIETARGNGYPDLLSLWRRAGVGQSALEALARADAFAGLGLSRRQALWAIKGLPPAPLPLFEAAGEEEMAAEAPARLPDLAPGEAVVEDYASLRLSLRDHPLRFLRAGLAEEGYRAAEALTDLRDGARIRLAGLVTVRQRPGTAKGVIFVTLEDETATANLVVWPDIFAANRKTVLKATLLGVEGRVQKEGLVIHVVAQRLCDLSPRLRALSAPCPARQPTVSAAPPARLFRSRDFH